MRPAHHESIGERNPQRRRRRCARLARPWSAQATSDGTATATRIAWRGKEDTARIRASSRACDAYDAIVSERSLRCGAAPPEDALCGTAPETPASQFLTPEVVQGCSCVNTFEGHGGGRRQLRGRARPKADGQAGAGGQGVPVDTSDATCRPSEQEATRSRRRLNRRAAEASETPARGWPGAGVRFLGAWPGNSRTGTGVSLRPSSRSPKRRSASGKAALAAQRPGVAAAAAHGRLLRPPPIRRRSPSSCLQRQAGRDAASPSLVPIRYGRDARSRPFSFFRRRGGW